MQRWLALFMVNEIVEVHSEQKVRCQRESRERQERKRARRAKAADTV